MQCVRICGRFVDMLLSRGISNDVAGIFAIRLDCEANNSTTKHTELLPRLVQEVTSHKEA